MATAQSLTPPKSDLFFKTVGEYTITKHLGNGKFGEVRIATHTTTKEAFAVKIVQRAKLKSRKDVDHINREITYMKLLNHPHLVTLKEALQTTNNIYLFMELVTGGDLIDRVTKDGRLPENVARKYFQQMIVGIRYLHLKRIAHRDIKLDNILYDKDTDSIKLADFGLANLADDADLMHTVVGSPHYVAPEVLRQADSGAKPGDPNSGYDGFQADLWSLGVILFTMLTGRYPFDDPNRKKLFEQITTGEFRMSRSIRPAAAALISKLLVCNPSKRYTVQDVLADEWFCTDFDPALLLLGDGVQVPMRGNALDMAASMQGSASPNGSTSGSSVPSISPTQGALQRMRDHPAADHPSKAAAAAAAAQQQQQQQEGADRSDAASPLVSKRQAPPSPQTGSLSNTSVTSPLGSNSGSSNSNGNDNGADAPRPAAVFTFLGDLDSCATTLCETLRRMGCLFNKPEQELSSNAQAAQDAAQTRMLYGYCNPRSNPTLQVFQVQMKLSDKASTTVVSVEHRIGTLPAFEQFAASVIANLGAKAAKQ